MSIILRNKSKFCTLHNYHSFSVHNAMYVCMPKHTKKCSHISLGGKFIIKTVSTGDTANRRCSFGPYIILINERVE